MRAGLEPATSWVKARCVSQFHQRIMSGESESRTRRPAFAGHLGSNEAASPVCRLSQAEAVRVELTSLLEPHRFEPCCYASCRASMAVVRGVDPPRCRRVLGSNQVARPLAGLPQRRNRDSNPGCLVGHYGLASRRDRRSATPPRRLRHGSNVHLRLRGPVLGPSSCGDIRAEDGSRTRCGPPYHGGALPDEHHRHVPRCQELNQEPDLRRVV
jgi:hypothetical protein